MSRKLARGLKISDNGAMSALTLTIVIPAYNEAANLSSCLDTIASQSIMPGQVIVVDNNSTDQTAEIAERYSFGHTQT